jgi:hypothetical protein
VFIFISHSLTFGAGISRSRRNGNSLKRIPSDRTMPRGYRTIELATLWHNSPYRSFRLVQRNEELLQGRAVFHRRGEG